MQQSMAYWGGGAQDPNKYYGYGGSAYGRPLLAAAGGVWGGGQTQQQMPLYGMVQQHGMVPQHEQLSLQHGMPQGMALQQMTPQQMAQQQMAPQQMAPQQMAQQQVPSSNHQRSNSGNWGQFISPSGLETVLENGTLAASSLLQDPNGILKSSGSVASVPSFDMLGRLATLSASSTRPGSVSTSPTLTGLDARLDDPLSLLSHLGEGSSNGASGENSGVNSGANSVSLEALAATALPG